MENNLFGDAVQRESFEKMVAARANETETTNDAMAPVIIASIMYCPAVIAASFAFKC